MRYLFLGLGVLLSLLVVSCASNGNDYPQVADAPPFDYVDGEELRSRMHQLAAALNRLDRDLATDYEERAPASGSIVDTLRDIERIGETLQSGDLSTKHPFLLNDMGKFLSDVERAIWDAQRSRYYRAGRITGSCVNCHRPSY